MTNQVYSDILIKKLTKCITIIANHFRFTNGLTPTLDFPPGSSGFRLNKFIFLKQHSVEMFIESVRNKKNYKSYEN